MGFFSGTTKRKYDIVDKPENMIRERKRNYRPIIRARNKK